MKPIVASIAVLSLALVATQNTAADDGHSPPKRFSTVTLFFMNQWFPVPPVEPQERSAAESSAARQGAANVMPMPFETVRLFLNDKFIGNAALQQVEVMPTLNLAPGDHKFRIECDGYQDYTQTLTVLENGSVQFLVVKLERRKPAVKAIAAPAAKK